MNTPNNFEEIDTPMEIKDKLKIAFGPQVSVALRNKLNAEKGLTLLPEAGSRYYYSNWKKMCDYYGAVEFCKKLPVMVPENLPKGFNLNESVGTKFLFVVGPFLANGDIDLDNLHFMKMTVANRKNTNLRINQNPDLRVPKSLYHGEDSLEKTEAVELNELLTEGFLHIPGPFYCVWPEKLRADIMQGGCCITVPSFKLSDDQWKNWYCERANIAIDNLKAHILS